MIDEFSTTLSLTLCRTREKRPNPPHRPPNRQLPKASAASAVGALFPSAVGALFPEDRHVGRHGGRLPLEQVAIPGWVARGGVGLGGGRLEQPSQWLHDALPDLCLWE